MIRVLLILIFLEMNCPAQFITNNLIMDLDARFGVQTSNAAPFSYVTNWVDNHTNVNNDGIFNNATNFNPTTTFLSTLDYFGQPVVYSPHGLNLDLGYAMNVPTNNLVANLTNNTIYVVCTPSLQHNEGTVCYWKNEGFKQISVLEVPQTTYLGPMRMGSVSRNGTNTLMPVNVSVLAMSCGPQRVIFAINHYLETNTAFGNSVCMGMELGGKTLTTYWGGFLYRVLVYSLPHTAAQIHSNVVYLSQSHNVVTNFQKVVVCRGDSRTEGYYCTNQQSWPFQLWERNPELLIYNAGVVSARISTNGVNQNQNVFYSNDWTWVDTMFTNNLCTGSPSFTSILLCKGGVNDIFTDSINGQVTYQRLTNYLAQRPAGVKKYVATIANASRSPAENTNYNAAIRADQSGLWWDGVSDSGCGSPIETRLNNYADQTYFASDQLHFIIAGAGVVCDHFQQFVNLPRRQTGFW